MKNKCTKEEKSRRIAVVFRLLIDGYLRHKIHHFINNEEKWGIAESSIDWYVREAAKLYIDATNNNAKIELGKALNRLTRIYNKSFKMQDYKTAISAQKEINCLMRLYDKDANPADREKVIID